MNSDQQDDPLATIDPDFDLDGDLPEGVDEAALARMRTVARILDDSIRVPGTSYRIGLDPLLGVVPGAGDALAAGLSLYIVFESARLGVSYTTLVRMLANVSVDVAGGSVPLLGDVFDAAWKANVRNVKLAVSDLADGPAAAGDTEPTRIDID